MPLLLMTARAAFYRRAQLIGEAISADGLGALAAGAICGLTLATVAYQSDLADRSWWGVVLAADFKALVRSIGRLPDTAWGSGPAAFMARSAAGGLLRQLAGWQAVSRKIGGWG